MELRWCITANPAVTVSAVGGPLIRHLGHQASSSSPLSDEKNVTGDGERVRLTAQGRLLSNQVFQEFLKPEIALTSRRA